MNKVVGIEETSEFKQHRHNSSIAMVVALVSFAMLFLTLMMSFTIYRLSNSVWPPMGFEQIPLLIPTISTVVIILSSFTFYKFEKSYNSNQVSSSKKWFYLTVFLAMGFVVSQFFLWKQLNLWGLYVESGIFASILHGFTWIHMAHVALGLMGFAYIFPVIRKENAFSRYLIRINNVGKFWHFLDIVWLVMFLILFVL